MMIGLNLLAKKKLLKTFIYSSLERVPYIKISLLDKKNKEIKTFKIELKKYKELLYKMVDAL